MFKRTLNTIVTMAGLTLVAVAIYQELQKPPEQRTWHGTIGPIPYNFRIPTPERIRERLWNPDDPHIFTEHIFGVGWAINFYSLLRRLDLISPAEASE